eukprot:scaffold107567_cov13-Tisochrysis_lutea.AAC.1
MAQWHISQSYTKPPYLLKCRGFMYVLFFSKWLLPSSGLTSVYGELLIGLMVPAGSRQASRTGAKVLRG